MNRHITISTSIILTIIITIIITIIMTVTPSVNCTATENETSYIYEDDYIKLCEYKGITLKHHVDWLSNTDEEKIDCYNEILDYMVEHCEIDPIENHPKALAHYTELQKSDYEELKDIYEATTPFEDDYFTYTNEDILNGAQDQYATDLIVNRVLKLENIDPRSSELVNTYKKAILDAYGGTPEKSEILQFIKYREFYRIVIENAKWDETYNDENNIDWTSSINYAANNEIKEFDEDVIEDFIEEDFIEEE